VPAHPGVTTGGRPCNDYDRERIVPHDVEQDLQQVRAMLRALAAEVDEPIRWLVEYSAPDRGKLLRPALLLLSAGAFGAVGPEHLRVATALELVHNATLLHDDVLDRGRVRRDLPTVNHRWGNPAAVRLGDILLAKVFEMNASFAPRVRAVLGRMIRRTCDGEIHQTASSGRLTLAEREYLTIVGRKTAALFRGASYLGALVAEAPARACRSAARFGYGLGMAYQIMDDLLDIVGDAKSLHKTPGTDLRNAKLTLPLIHALHVLPEPRRSSLLLALQRRRLTRSELLDVLAASGSIDYVLARIGRYAARAAGALAAVRQTPMKAALLEMPQRIVQEAVEQSAKVGGRSLASCRVAAQG
jgi:geranylgeranyl pyrophosphate synthase